MSKRKKPEPKEYAVPFRATFQGTAFVTATSEEEAFEMVESGKGIEINHTCEMVDWEATGDAECEK